MRSYTDQQLQAIRESFQFLARHTSSRSDTESVAKALCARCPGLEYADALQAVQQMADGAACFRSCRAAAPAEGGTINAQWAMIWAVQGLTVQQRRGMYLQCYEFFRQAQPFPEARQAQDASEIAELPENELLELVSEQLLHFSEQLCNAALSAAEDMEPTAEVLPDEPLLFAAAAYSAGINGDLPEVIEKNPGLLGVSAAARSTLLTGLTEAAQQEEPQPLAEIVLTTLLALVAVVLSIILLAAALQSGVTVMEFFLALNEGAAFSVLTPFVTLAFGLLGAAAGTATAILVAGLPAALLTLAAAGLVHAREWYKARQSTREAPQETAPPAEPEIHPEDEERPTPVYS